MYTAKRGYMQPTRQLQRKISITLKTKLKCLNLEKFCKSNHLYFLFLIENFPPLKYMTDIFTQTPLFSVFFQLTSLFNKCNFGCVVFATFAFFLGEWRRINEPINTTQYIESRIWKATRECGWAGLDVPESIVLD